MFNYRPPKSSCWGHVLSPKENAWEILDAFLDAYFEPKEANSDTTTRILAWREALLPSIEWPPDYAEKDRIVMFTVMLDRVMFPMGIHFPISSTDPASYEFLRRFCAEAPFKMKAKHFKVGVACKNGSMMLRKPDAALLTRLEQVVP